MDAKDKSFDDIKIGDKASFDREISIDDIRNFADISGDHNPLHTDSKYASHTEFKKQVVHGMFFGSLVSRLVGMELPGKRALLIKESLDFKKPGFVGDKVTVQGEVTFKSTATKIIEVGVEINRGKDVLVSGSAHVRVLP